TSITPRPRLLQPTGGLFTRPRNSVAPCAEALHSPNPKVSFRGTRNLTVKYQRDRKGCPQKIVIPTAGGTSPEGKWPTALMRSFSPGPNVILRNEGSAVQGQLDSRGTVLLHADRQISAAEIERERISPTALGAALSGFDLCAL